MTVQLANLRDLIDAIGVVSILALLILAARKFAYAVVRLPRALAAFARRRFRTPQAAAGKSSKVRVYYAPRMSRIDTFDLEWNWPERNPR